MDRTNDGDLRTRHRPGRATWASAASLAIGLALFASSLIHVPEILTPAARKHAGWALACLAVGVLFTVLPGLRGLRLFVRKALFESKASRFYGALFAAAVVSYALMSQLVFHASPRIDDEVSALFQARIFAAGALTLPLPPKARFFELFGVLGGKAACGHWCTMYTPGWPLLLVPGVLAGMPWMIDPVLGGLLVVMIAVLGTTLFGLRIGRTAGLFALSSPFLATLAASHMTHTATALFLVVLMWAMIRLLSTGRALFGAIAGTAWSMAFLCRPFTAVVAGAAIVIVAVLRPRRAWAARLGLASALVLALAGVAAVAAWQYETTGNPLRSGYDAELGQRGLLGFGSHFTLAAAWEYTGRRIQVVNEQLLGWPAPALWLVMLPFLLVRARGKEVWLLAPLAALLAGYAFYWYFEWEIPGRYVFEALPMLLILVARGMEALGGAEARLRRAGRPLGSAILLTSGILFSLTAGFQAQFSRFGPDYWDVENTLPHIMEEFRIHRALVFIGGNGYYTTGFMRNRLDLQGDIVFARDLGGPVDRRLMAIYPGRHYYFYRYFKSLKDAALSEMRVDGTQLAFLSLHSPAGLGDHRLEGPSGAPVRPHGNVGRHPGKRTPARPLPRSVT
ncbi:MAG TPA: glycosyltransferase family 39 protein [Acidobacteriota bacterium]|nr:glycosyltransferase family 39 protein [Acidobacteriota bacterium]